MNPWPNSKPTTPWNIYNVKVQKIMGMDVYEMPDKSEYFQTYHLREGNNIEAGKSYTIIPYPDGTCDAMELK